MKDRIVQYPNRYRLVAVDGQPNVFDFEAVTGTITEQGTPLNKANLLTDATATLLGLSGNPSVNDAFRGVLSTSVTLSHGFSRGFVFLQATDTETINIAFGQYETNPKGVGYALAMYASNKSGGVKSIDVDFPNLAKCDTCDQIHNNPLAVAEASSDTNIVTIIHKSPYATEHIIGEVVLWKKGDGISRWVMKSFADGQNATIDADGNLLVNPTVGHRTGCGLISSVVVQNNSARLKFTGTFYITAPNDNALRLNNSGGNSDGITPATSPTIYVEIDNFVDNLTVGQVVNAGVYAYAGVRGAEPFARISKVTLIPW